MAAVNPLAQAAQDRFIAQHFENEPNLVTRRAAMAAAEAGAAGLPNATLAKNAKPIYKQLLTDAMRAIDRFNLDNFGAEPNLVTRHGAIQAAIANAGAHGLSPFGLQQYQALLNGEFGPLDAAIAAFAGFVGANADLVAREALIRGGVAALANPAEDVHYQALLAAEQVNLAAAIAAFNGHNFAAIGDVRNAYLALKTAIANAGAAIVDATQRGYYLALLNGELADAAYNPIRAAIGRFDAHHFAAQADLVARHRAIRTARLAVPGGLGPVEQAHYEALLDAEFAPLDAAIAAFAGFVGANGDLVAREALIRGGVAALANPAQNAHYQALLAAEQVNLAAAIAAFAGFVGANADLVAREALIRGGVAALANPAQNAHYQALLAAEQVNLAAAIAAFAGFVGANADLVAREALIRGGVAALANPAQNAHFQALLAAEQVNLAAAIAAFAGFVGANADLVAREALIRGGVAALANPAEDVHYQALLAAHLVDLTPAIAAFNAFVGANADLVAREALIRGGVAALANPAQNAHFQALLAAEQVNLAAAIAAFAGFVGANADLVAREALIRGGVAALANPAEDVHFQALLAAEQVNLTPAIAAFNAFVGANADLVAREALIRGGVAALANPAEDVHYQALLAAEQVNLAAAIAAFNAFVGANADLVAREALIRGGVVALANPAEDVHYQALLAAEQVNLAAAIAAFNAFVGANADLVAREALIRGGVAALANPAQNAHYQALLAAEQVNLAAAIAAFAGFVGANADLVAREALIRGGVAALANPAQNAHYQALLAAEQVNLAAAIAAFAGFVGANADLVAREALIRGGVAALANPAQNAHYQALLAAEQVNLAAAIAAFAGFVGANADLVAREALIRGGVAALANPAQNAHFQALLAAEQVNLAAAIAAFAGFVGANADLVAREALIRGGVAALANPAEDVHYQALLAAHLVDLTPAIAAFNAFVGANADLVAREALIRGGVAALANPAQNAHFQALLAAEQVNLAAAIAAFAGFVGANADLVAREALIRGGVAALANPAEDVHFQALLAAEQVNLTPAVAAFNAFVGANADLVAREATIRGGVAALANPAQDVHYQALLAAEQVNLAAAINRFNAHNFAAQPDLVVRHGAMQAAIGGVALGLGAAEQAHYQALLNAEFGPLDAAVNQFNIDNFAAEADLDQRRDDVHLAITQAHIHGLVPQAEALYRALLNTTHTALNQAITTFENHHFDHQPNLVTRHGEVQAAIANAAAQGLNPEALVHYGALLADEFTPLNAALVRFNGRNFDQFGNLVDRRTQIAAAIAGIGGLGLTPVEEGHYQTLLEAKAKETSVALGTQRFAAHQFEKTTNVRDRLTSVREAISKAPGVVYVDHTGDEQASYTASLKRVETYLVAAVRRCDAHKFREQANFATRRTVIDAAIAKISTLPLLPGEEPCYRALLAVERTLASNGVAQERFNAHRFNATQNLSARLQLFEQAIQRVDTLGISDAAEKTHYLALLTSNRQITATALSQTVTRQAVANVSTASNLVQERTAIAEQLARVQSQFPVGSAEGRQVQAELQARSPSSTMVVQQTAQRMAQAMKSGSPTGQQQLVQDVKQLSDEERRKAAALAARMAWGK